MTPKALRSWLRWTHILVGLVIGAYICSPLHLDPGATVVARLALVPAIAVTGLSLWKQGQLTGIWRRLTGRVQASASPSQHA